MALSRTLSQSMPRVEAFFSLTTLRHSSAKATPQLIEVDLDSSESTEVIAVGVKNLEDAIRTIMVRRAAPDWLPFMPGHSYWVPPPPPPSPSRGGGPQPSGLIEVVGKLAEASASTRGSRRFLGHDYVASDDELMAIASSRGWPSSDFFIQGSTHLPVVEVEVHIQETEIQLDDSHNPEDVEE